MKAKNIKPKINIIKNGRCIKVIKNPPWKHYTPDDAHVVSMVCFYPDLKEVDVHIRKKHTI